MSTKVAVSGASGFVGQAILSRLIQENRTAMAFVRNVGAQHIGEIDADIVSLVDRTSWLEAMRQCAVFIHCAGRAHITKGLGRDALHEFRLANTELTLELARSAAYAGVKRFVFVSSIGVNGQKSGREPFTPEGVVNPETPYAISKYEAELGLKAISRETGLEVVVVRPPLVYGAGAPGNFGSLMRAVQHGWPLPLGAVHNKRSLVALGNLVDFIITCTSHPAAANQTFLVSDGQDLSTSELVRAMSLAAGVPTRLLPIPVSLLRLAGRWLGKADAIDRLCGNLQVDSSKARDLLGWLPPISVEEGLLRAMRGDTI